MNTPSTRSHGRRRRRRFGAVALAVATVATTFAASPASAAPAPLVTEDGIGIRIDENAILGPALQAIEDELQPFVNSRIYQGALDNSVMDNPDWVQGSADLDLSFDFINAGTPGYPEGGLKVRGDLRNIMMRFYRYGAWWQPECQFRVNPADGWIEATAKIDTSKLPGNPITINPISAYWDNDPDITREKGNFLCTGYLFDEWWDGLWGNRTNVAAQLEAEMDDVAQDLIDDLWTDYVTPVVDSLAGFGIGFGQVRTDDHGLIVTADVDATAGVTIPGALENPYNVSAAEDSGVTSDVNALLAQRGEVIVSVHPNVVNQYLLALNASLYGQFGNVPVPASIENDLLDPADRGAYADDGWEVGLSVNVRPYTKPTGPGGAPEMRIDDALLIVRNSNFGAAPLAMYQGSVSAIGIVTEVRAGSNTWGPAYSPVNTSMSMSLIYADPAITAHGADPNVLLPHLKSNIDYFNGQIFEPLVSLAPITIGGLSIDLCTTCGRYSGDQRYTETFLVS